jgi:hypothetical protein
MALYYHLAVYKSSYQLLQIILSESDNFSRQYKYTLGQQMKDEAINIIKNIYRANKALDKVPAIEEARENLEMIRLHLRLVQDFDQLDLKKFIKINQNIEDVSKQLTNWENFSRKNYKEAKPLIPN